MDDQAWARGGLPSLQNAGPAGNDGILGRAVYRAEIDGDPETTLYVNIGTWRTREDFYAGVPGVMRGMAPEPQDFEEAPRRRLWVSPVLG